ncbi:low temperature requirement protein A [Micromonospora soli]|uniref:low temperature requirement protein A n=1 Tax=Micromonospora sp. NBRC 110009 TaxID=3061627 RepID=UPI0026741598|nr:low temperature requirement protein A [Micromonospora sp. NBRC 110009]WKT99009.1 low temperature requirement protein A [Micromonospora sp. NBRC 110009]
MGEPGSGRRTESIWRRASLLELFFDLVFVFALDQLGMRLINELNTGRPLRLGETVETVLLFLALWFMWVSTVATTSVRPPDSLLIQTVVFISMAGAVVMAVAVQGFGQRVFVFASTYIAANMGRQLLLVVVRPRWIATPTLLSGVVSIVPWMAGALVDDDDLRAALWALALALEYGGLVVGWLRYGVAIAGEHLAERLEQFLLIALGAAIFLSGRALSNSDFGIPHAAGFGLAFVATVLLWRIYLYRAGLTLAPAITRARNPVRQSVGVAGSHLLMIAGVVLAGVGFELYISEPAGRPDPRWLVAILGGPALFLAGRAPFELQVFGRISRSRLTGLLALGLLIPATWHAPPLAAGGAAAAVLAGIAGSDAWRARGRAPELPAPRI